MSYNYIRLYIHKKGSAIDTHSIPAVTEYVLSCMRINLLTYFIIYHYLAIGYKEGKIRDCLLIKVLLIVIIALKWQQHNEENLRKQLQKLYVAILKRGFLCPDCTNVIALQFISNNWICELSYPVDFTRHFVAIL